MKRRFTFPVHVDGALHTREEPNQLEMVIQDPGRIPEVVRAADHHFSTQRGMNVEKMPDNPSAYDEKRAVLEYVPQVPDAEVDQIAVFHETIGLIRELRDRADPDTPFKNTVDQYIADHPGSKVSVDELRLANTMLDERQVVQAVRKALHPLLPDEVDIVTGALVPLLANKPRPPAGLSLGAGGETQDALWFVVENALPAAADDVKRNYARSAVFDALADAYMAQARIR